MKTEIDEIDDDQLESEIKKNGDNLSVGFSNTRYNLSIFHATL